MKKKGGPLYARTFNKIGRDPRLSAQVKGMYFCLKTYANKEGVCYPSIRALCVAMDASKNSVLAWLGDLIKRGIISRQPRYSRGRQQSSAYIFNDEHYVKHCCEPGRGSNSEPQEGFKNCATVEEEPLKNNTPTKIIHLNPRTTYPPRTRKSAIHSPK